MNLELEDSWKSRLSPEFEQDYMLKLNIFLDEQLKQEKRIFPNIENIFSAFKYTPFDKTRVVIIGQDPYHGAGQAHGLSFSVNKEVKIPPSLKNIYKELCSDLSIEVPTHGNLSSWALQGVLMLNNVLTVEESKAGSHQNKGWEKFTDKVIEVLNNEKENLVFILWGSSAQKKGCHIDNSKHLILKSVHPSPLSAYRGFFGSKPFSRTNEYLVNKKRKPISWVVK